MKKIKDFFYDKNDIIVVLIILALAAFIIYSRIGIIMDYPEKMADESAATTQTTVEETGTSAPEEPASEPEESDSDNTEKKTDSSSDETITVKITDDDSSVSVAKKLEKAGLVESATEFEGYISNMDKADKIQSGSFEIKKGSSFEEILNTITK